MALRSLAQTVKEYGSLISSPDVPRRVREDFLRLVDSSSKLITIEIHAQPAIGTANSSFSLEPSDLFVSLLFAARASDWEKVTILQHEALTPDLVAQSG